MSKNRNPVPPFRASLAPAALNFSTRPFAIGFGAVFEGATKPQELGWPAIARGDSTLILAPTGTGKTLRPFCGVSIA